MAKYDKIVKVFPIGTDVVIDSNVKGIIIGITIREKDAIVYEVSWWDGFERKLEKFAECELKFPVNQKQQKIGFKNP